MRVGYSPLYIIMNSWLHNAIYFSIKYFYPILQRGWHPDQDTLIEQSLILRIVKPPMAHAHTSKLQFTMALLGNSNSHFRKLWIPSHYDFFYMCYECKFSSIYLFSLGVSAVLSTQNEN